MYFYCDFTTAYSDSRHRARAQLTRIMKGIMEHKLDKFNYQAYVSLPFKVNKFYPVGETGIKDTDVPYAMQIIALQLIDPTHVRVYCKTLKNTASQVLDKLASAGIDLHMSIERVWPSERNPILKFLIRPVGPQCNILAIKPITQCLPEDILKPHPTKFFLEGHEVQYE